MTKREVDAVVADAMRRVREAVERDMRPKYRLAPKRRGDLGLALERIVYPDKVES